MPVLSNSRHEHFALAVAKGVSVSKAYVSAGFSGKGASTSGARMLSNALICSRVRELQETLSAGVIALEISSRNTRVMALQDRWARLRAKIDFIMDARGQAMADAPGGASGLYAKDFRGKDAKEVYKIDLGIVALFAELRAIEKQAAEELGQWTEKRASTVDVALTSITVEFVNWPPTAPPPFEGE